MRPVKILLIEDDREILDVMSVGFEMNWPEMKLVSTRLGREGVELAASENPDVIILDLGLPDITGFEVLKEIRAFSKVPILILTVRSDETDFVRGIELGADDYMTKPFHQTELKSRVEALIRPADTHEL